MATTAAVAQEWGRGSAALAAMAVPPGTVLAALGLGGVGLASGDAAVAATGAFAGAVGAGVATWRASALQARMRRDRERFLESRRTVQLLIGQLRQRAVGKVEPVVVEPVVVEPDLVEPDMVEPDMVEPDMVEPDMVESVVVESDMVEPDRAFEPGGVRVDVPGTVPDELLGPRSSDAPANSMKLAVLSTLDEPVAAGHLAAVVELRAVPRPVAPSALPIGELERRVYAAIAAQDAEQELSAPAVEATAVCALRS